MGVIHRNKAVYRTSLGSEWATRQRPTPVTPYPTLRVPYHMSIRHRPTWPGLHIRPSMQRAVTVRVRVSSP